MQIVPKLGMICKSFLEFHGEIILDKCKENSAKPRDDEQSGDSNSIINQKKMLEKYATEQGFTNLLHYFIF